MKPFFSIIVPCCDVEPYVRECFESVLNQSFKDWEIVAVVETSKDKTEEIVREYAAKDSRISVFTQPRSGSPAAPRNTALEKACGKYAVFVDSDDTIAPDSLRRIHDKITSAGEADLYPCAVQVHNDITGNDEELRDNYPASFAGVLTGAEATLMAAKHRSIPCPMLQMTVCSMDFLDKHKLRCIDGLRMEDSEFSPRALYLAKRVIPLHEPFYIYRIRRNSVCSSAKGAGYFLGDWAVILRSLLAFHLKVSAEPGFDSRLSTIWGTKWTRLMFYFWFNPANVRAIPRSRRVETLQTLFANGFVDFDALLRILPRSRRVAGWWVKAFVRHPMMRMASELFFKMYFLLAARSRNGDAQ